MTFVNQGISWSNFYYRLVVKWQVVHAGGQGTPLRGSRPLEEATCEGISQSSRSVFLKVCTMDNPATPKT